MGERFAVLLDGGFVRKRIAARKRKEAEEAGVDYQRPTVADVLAECRRVYSHPQLQGLGLLRVYWYDAPPASKNGQNPISGKTVNLGRSEMFRDSKHLLDSLEMEPNFALRLGEVAGPRGWSAPGDVLKANNGVLAAEDIKPRLEQKGVDLRIGLDIARLSIRRLVSVIVVATGDSDMVPAFKFARREGMRVYLDSMSTPFIKRDVKAHVDYVLS